MRLECGWHHDRKRWSWEFEDFEKELRLDHWGESWVSAVEKCSFFGVFFKSLTTKILNITRYAERWGWGQQRKNCVSLHVSPWSEVRKLINHSYMKQQSPPVFCIWVCIVLMLLLRWLWLYNNICYSSIISHAYIHEYILMRVNIGYAGICMVVCIFMRIYVCLWH